MQDAWIYSSSRDAVRDLSEWLAELGFRPRHVGREGALVPAGDDGPTLRAPALAVVAARPGEAAPNELCAELHRREELADVPILLSLEPEHLSSFSKLDTVHELLVRPFSPEELRARIARARREASHVETDEVVRAGSLELNLVTYQASIEGAAVSFAFMEYELLKFLMTHPDRVFSREALLRGVWGYEYYGGARTVDVHIRRIRAKLAEHASRIKTIRSVGYLFESADSSRGTSADAETPS